MSVRREVQRERRQAVGINPRAVRRPEWPQLTVRFAFGAAIAIAAGLLGMRFGARVGGVFLAFPAILPAALTLLERTEGVTETGVDAVGASLGAAAMLVFSLTILWLGRRVPPAAAVVIAAGVWMIVAAALFAVARPLLGRMARRG